MDSSTSARPTSMACCASTPALARPAVGERVWLIPGHCDPTVNLYDWIVGVRGDRVECVWPVAARGALG